MRRERETKNLPDQGLLGRISQLDRVSQVLAPFSGGAGHLQVHAGLDTAHDAVHAESIAHCHATAVPFNARGVGQQFFAVAGTDPVGSRIAVHDTSRICVADCNLKWHQVQLAQTALRHGLVHNEPQGFLVACSEMLDGRGHTVFLRRSDIYAAAILPLMNRSKTRPPSGDLCRHALCVWLSKTMGAWERKQRRWGEKHISPFPSPANCQSLWCR